MNRDTADQIRKLTDRELALLAQALRAAEEGCDVLNQHVHPSDHDILMRVSQFFSFPTQSQSWSDAAWKLRDRKIALVTRWRIAAMRPEREARYARAARYRSAAIAVWQEQERRQERRAAERAERAERAAYAAKRADVLRSLGIAA